MADGITDEMVVKAARAHAAHEGYDWTEVSEFWQRRYLGMARIILESALDGRTGLDLPEPDGWTYGGSVRWDASARRIIAKVDEQGRPFIRLDGQIWLVGEAESVGLALVAAAREAQRQAAEVARSDDTAALPGDTPQQTVEGGDDRGVSNPSSAGGVQ